MSSKKVAIVGGGVSGLAAAWALKWPPHNVCLYEADERLGVLIQRLRRLWHQLASPAPTTKVFPFLRQGGGCNSLAIADPTLPLSELPASSGKSVLHCMKEDGQGLAKFKICLETASWQ
jgi:hypothetical protein